MMRRALILLAAMGLFFITACGGGGGGGGGEENHPPVVCNDADGDGYGNPGDASCTAGSATDCNDADAAIHPGASESACDGIDNDCDGATDEDYVADASCGVGACQTNNTPSTCIAGVETACQAGAAAAVDPTYNGDGIDNDCDGQIDEDPLALTPNSTTDAADANPGDGICDDGAGNCTLRAAIEEANACAGADTIDVPVGTYVLTLGQLVIDDELTLIGADAASTIIDGNAVSRIFSVAANVASVELSEFTARNGNDQYGGAFYIGANSPTTIRRAVIRDNTATQAGGAFYLSSNADLTLEECTVTRNKQTGNNPGGHAFLVSIGDNLAIRASTISYNPPAGVAVSSDINDSAILDWTNSQSPTIQLENSTLAGNPGTAVYAYTAAVDVINSTITGNGKGLYASTSNLTAQINVTNSILSNNGTNCALNGGTITSAGHNIDSANTCGFAAAGDLVNTDPMLGALADNGGPTHSRGLLAVSPALDAGDNTVCPDTDQRGVARDDGACDIGAVEGVVAFTTCLGANVIVDSTSDTVDADPGDGICDDGAGNCTLRAAIQETNACLGADVIDLPAGTYLLGIAGNNENASATGDLDITDDLTINGAGAASTIIDGNGSKLNDRVFHVLNQAATTFDGLTIQGGQSNSGGAIYSGGDLTILNAIISENTVTQYGGGICNWATGATVTIANTSLLNNSTGDDGYGGAVLVGGTLNIADSILSGNLAGSYGAAVYGHNGSTIEIVRSQLDGNTGTNGNTAGWAAVVGMNNATVIITDSTISNSGTATDPAKSTRGVQVYTDSTLTLTRSTVTGNKGGGVSCSGNPACAGLTVTDSAIEGNTCGAVGSFGCSGTGISTSGQTLVTGSSISNNYVTATLGGTGSGGGIWASSDLTVVNSTISGNTIPNNAVGGAIYFSGTTGILTNVTIADNHALYGPGVRVQNNAATLTITNSILSASWTGHAGSCIIGEGVIVSGGHNIDNANTCGFNAEGDLINTDPLIDVLADNGGPTKTRALLEGSPAIDAADDAICAAAPVNGVDQRGVSRPQGDHCDIGAYEDEAP